MDSQNIPWTQMNKLGDLLHVFAPRVHHVHGASTSLSALFVHSWTTEHTRPGTVSPKILKQAGEHPENDIVSSSHSQIRFWQIPQPVPKTLESHDSRSLKGAAAAWVKAQDLPDLRFGSNRKKDGTNMHKLGQDHFREFPS